MGIEQEAQRRLGIFAIHALVFLVAHAAAVVHHAEQHQGRHAFGGVDPVRLVDMLEVGRRHVKLPAVVAVLGLKAHGGRLAQQVRLIQLPQGQIAIDGRSAQQALGRFDQPFARVHAIVFHEFDGPPSGKMAPRLVGGAQLQGRDQLAVALQLRLRQQTRLAVVGPVRGVWFVKDLQRPIDGRRGDAV